MRGAFLIYQSSAVRPTPSGAEGAYSRTPVPIDLRFRPCLCRFFTKGTVGYTPQPPISTVPLTFFSKRHGRLRPTASDFDRAFDHFLQKARSATPHNLRFRPCLCRFFAKGTVGHAICPAFLTVPLPFFSKRHGRPCPLPRDFDRASAIFPQKARHSLSWGCPICKKGSRPVWVGFCNMPLW